MRLCRLDGVSGLGHHKVLGGLTAGHLMYASERIGNKVGKLRDRFTPKPPPISPAPPLTQISSL